MTSSGCTGTVVRPPYLEACFDVLIEIATAIVVGEYAYVVGGELASLASGQTTYGRC